MTTLIQSRRSRALQFLACALGVATALCAGPARALEPPARSETGLASWYNQPGGLTSSGLRFNAHSNMAAHKTLPMGTVAIVTNLDNGRTEVVRIVDRGPFIRGRIIDLTPTTARALGVGDRGVMHVTVTPLSIPPGPPKVIEVAEGPEKPRAHQAIRKPAALCAIDMAAAFRNAGL